MAFLNDIVVAAQNRETVEITYMKRDGSVVVREIEPYSERDGYLFGYDVNEGTIKKFIISNIVSASRTGKKFMPRWEVEF